ncbi:MAG: phosphate ABC transporter ATP-binding protein [Chloroflexi bacterium]|nr:phosphate ABC transporter ATP-binding protein [Chloroflexota bacterium]
MTAVFSVQNARKTYNRRTVLDVPELTIHAGEVFTLVGPSGAGKSTLLRLLALLETPSTGTVRYHAPAGPVTHDSATIEDRRQLAMVFQRPALLSRSVYHNVAYGLRVRGSRNGHQRITTALERVAMQPLAGQNPQQLSGGEMQRVAVARALVLEPRVLLLDEPTANLDPTNVRIIEDLITEQNRDFGTTIVLVTHNIFQARRLATRVALLIEGRIVENSPTEVFFDDPTDPRTRAFVSGDLIY